MPTITPNNSFYLPGGGSENIGGPDEPADIDQINKNFQILDEVTIKKTAAGSVTVTPPEVQVEVPFPSGRFSSPPRVAVTVRNVNRASFAGPTISGVSSSSFDLNVERIVGSAAFQVDWIAMETG